MCERNDQFIRITNITPLTRFHALQAPEVMIKSLLRRIQEECKCSEQSFVLALIYIDRLIWYDRDFQVNSLSIHRVIITSILIGVKFYDEPIFKKINKHFAEVGYITPKEIDMLEMDFLFSINFNLFVHPDLYNYYNQRLLPRIQLQEEKEGSIWKSGNKGGPQYNEEKDDAAPRTPTATYCPPPMESKEVDRAHEPEFKTQRTSSEAGLSRGAMNYTPGDDSPSPQTESYLREEWV